MNVLALDIGGSGSRAVLGSDADRIVSGAPLRIVDGAVDVSEALRTLAVALPESVGEPDVIALGLASLIAHGEPRDIVEQIRRQWRSRRVVVASDAVTALISAWGLGGGAVVAAGTGVVGLGTDFGEEWHRVDGWGPFAGDAGGGAWIGARALQAALRAHDGRAGGSPVLLAAAVDRFGEPDRLPAAITASASPARELAGFVPSVAVAARAGDAVATHILENAARELAVTAAAALADGVPRRVALVGGLTGIGAPLLDPFEDEVRRLVPDSTVSSGGVEPVRGALALAEAAASHSERPTPYPPYLYI